MYRAASQKNFAQLLGSQTKQLLDYSIFRLWEELRAPGLPITILGYTQITQPIYMQARVQSRFQNKATTKIQKYKSTKVQKYKNSKIQKFRCVDQDSLQGLELKLSTGQGTANKTGRAIRPVLPMSTAASLGIDRGVPTHVLGIPRLYGLMSPGS